MNNLELAVQFFLQLAVILASCRLVGVVAARLGQPQVVAEMITGVLLGPSLFGLLLPTWQAALFPWDVTQSSRDTQSYLFPISQFGLALYMFIVGLEFRVDIVRDRLRGSVAVSIAGMVTPFVLGAVLGWWFQRSTDLFPEKTSSAEAAVFLGASMCITAFPMLARIIHFKGLAGTTMGTIAIGAGAMDDATAWCLLACVLASFDDNLLHAARNIGGGIGFVIVALAVLRPLLRKAERWMLGSEGTVSEIGLVVGMSFLCLGAWFTDLVGLHAVFGAFVMGAIMPRGSVAQGLIRQMQPIAVSILLPLFFTYSGLNTSMGLLVSWSDWGLCGLVLVTAILGKGVACTWAAWTAGLPRREAMGIGILMNARGLMELIIINIGLSRGIISDRLFAILVMMAVVTTLMASPIFDWLVGADPPTQKSYVAGESSQTA